MNDNDTPQQNTPEQPATQPDLPPTSPAPTPTAPSAVDPGKTLGVVGFILAFVANLFGLIISIIALNKSKKAGYKNGLALAGIIISSIGLVLGTIAGIMRPA